MLTLACGDLILLEDQLISNLLAWIGNFVSFVVIDPDGQVRFNSWYTH